MLNIVRVDYALLEQYVHALIIEYPSPPYMYEKVVDFIFEFWSISSPTDKLDSKGDIVNDFSSLRIRDSHQSYDLILIGTELEDPRGKVSYFHDNGPFGLGIEV